MSPVVTSRRSCLRALLPSSSWTMYFVPSSRPLTCIFTVANFSGSRTVYLPTIESLERPATSVMAPRGWSAYIVRPSSTERGCTICATVPYRAPCARERPRPNCLRAGASTTGATNRPTPTGNRTPAVRWFSGLMSPEVGSLTAKGFGFWARPTPRRRPRPCGGRVRVSRARAPAPWSRSAARRVSTAR